MIQLGKICLLEFSVKQNMKSSIKFLFCFILAVSLSSCGGNDINSYKHGKVILPWTTMSIGKSMEPTIHAGDLVTISEFPYENLESGMIIARFSISDSEHVVTHRIIGKLQDGTFITRGDNNELNDIDVMTRENYVGIVRKGGEKPQIGVIILKKNQ